jgi:hypothetical protein
VIVAAENVASSCTESVGTGPLGGTDETYSTIVSAFERAELRSDGRPRTPQPNRARPPHPLVRYGGNVALQPAWRGGLSAFAEAAAGRFGDAEFNPPGRT